MKWLRSLFSYPVPESPEVNLDEFQVGEKKLPWGATVRDLKDLGFLSEEYSEHDLNIEAKVEGVIFGLPYCSIEFHCFASGKPIEQVWYRFPSKPSQDHLSVIRAGHNCLRQVLGKPSGQSLHVDDICITSPNDVVLHAKWQRKHGYWGVSWFGDVRTDGGVSSSGFVYFHWEDEIEAAAPYLPAYRASQVNLETMKPPLRIAAIKSEHLSEPRHFRAYEQGRSRASDGKDLLMESQRAMYAPRLLFTPAKWIKSLNIDPKGEFVFWKTEDGICGVSTAFDTWCAGGGEGVVLEETLMHPAKGPGAHYLKVGELEVTCPYDEKGNELIRNAIEAIKTSAKVEHTFRQDSNC